MLLLYVILELELELRALLLLELVVALATLNRGQISLMDLHFSIAIFLNHDVKTSLKAAAIHF